MRSKFYILLNAILQDTKLSIGAKVIYSIIYSVGGRRGAGCMLSVSTLARRSGSSKRAVNYWLVELQDGGYISRISRTDPDSKVGALYISQEKLDEIEKSSQDL